MSFTCWQKAPQTYNIRKKSERKIGKENERVRGECKRERERERERGGV